MDHETYNNFVRKEVLSEKRLYTFKTNFSSQSLYLNPSLIILLIQIIKEIIISPLKFRKIAGTNPGQRYR